MDVFYCAGGEVIVQDDVDSFEINSSGQQSRADQHPNFTRAETVHNIVSLEQKTHTKKMMKYWKSMIKYSTTLVH